MSDIIQISGSLRPKLTNLPLDARSVVENLEGIKSIVNPYVGLPVFVKELNKTYIVTALNADEDAIKTMVRLADETDVISLDEKVVNETTRAKKAEEDLSTKIDNLDKKIVTLSVDGETILVDDNVIKVGQISIEQVQNLQDQLASFVSDDKLQEEIDRAKHAESRLDSLIADVTEAHYWVDSTTLTHALIDKDEKLLESTDLYGNKRFYSDVQVDKDLDVVGGINVEGDINSPTIAALQAQIDMLVADAKLSISCSPSVVYKGVQTSVIISARMTEILPDKLAIFEGTTTGTKLAEVFNAQAISNIMNITTSVDKPFTALVNYSVARVKAATTLLARYPIYCGFSKSLQALKDAIIVGQTDKYTKLSARTSAAGTYTAQALESEVYYFILVPSDINALSTFTMGGMPYVMDLMTTITLEGVIYKVYKSGAIYSTGANVKITAS